MAESEGERKAEVEESRSWEVEKSRSAKRKHQVSPLHNPS